MMVVFLAFWSSQGPRFTWCLGGNGLELVSSSRAVSVGAYYASGEFTNPPLAVDIIGDRAFAAGTYTLTIAIPQAAGGTAPMVITAKYLTIFRPVGNCWRILFDMQNGDTPPPR
jgi:hypothetical protein